MLKSLKKFKKKHKGLHRFVVFACIASMSWATWKLLDYFTGELSPLVAGVSTIVIGITILALDDLHLKELG